MREADRRQLEDEQDGAEAVALVEEIKKGVAGAPSDIARRAALHRARRGRGAAATGSRVALAAQNMHFEEEGAFTGEVSAADARGRRAQPRHPRPLRAPAVLRRDRRGRREEDEGRARRGPRCRSSASARRSPSARPGGPMEVVGRQVRRDPRRRHRRRGEAGRHRLRARLGHRHRARWRRRSRPRRSTPSSARASRPSHGQAVADGLRILYGGSVKPDNAGPDGAARHRRRPRRRRVAQGRLVPEDRPLRQAVGRRDRASRGSPGHGPEESAADGGTVIPRRRPAKLLGRPDDGPRRSG